MQRISKSPFAIQTEKQLVALKGQRKGYLQLASSVEVYKFSALSPHVLIAAHEWACILEDLGATNVYWLTLSEVIPHKHIHLFPRWPEDELSGLELFATRDNADEPSWNDESKEALANWCADHDVQIL